MEEGRRKMLDGMGWARPYHIVYPLRCLSLASGLLSTDSFQKALEQKSGLLAEDAGRVPAWRRSRRARGLAVEETSVTETRSIRQSSSILGVWLRADLLSLVLVWSWW